MSSWQEHVDALVRTGKVSRAAICGLDGATWAASSGFQVDLNEARVIAAAINNKDYAALLVSQGVYVNGDRYNLVKSDLGENLFAKRAGHAAGGCYARKTGQALIVAIFNEVISAATCVCEIEKLADYYISMQL
eukprot:m.54806 g.54806  ORF g.54806 m.54806 type:complete len:134 (-) comp13268_c0_seq2:936-1337(-)